MNLGIRKRTIRIFVLFLLLVSLCSFYLILSHKHIITVPCLFHKITGFYCPGCGMTRAFYSLIMLDFMGSLKNNLLLVFIIPTTIYYLWHFFKNYIFTGNIISIDDVIPNWVLLVELILAISYGILRNIELFSWMQPI